MRGMWLVAGETNGSNLRSFIGSDVSHVVFTPVLEVLGLGLRILGPTYYMRIM
jgi:hypothetical protein